MFKKPLKSAQSNVISGKDRKKLKKDLAKFFHSDTLDQLFVNTDEIVQEKIQGNKTLIYKDSVNPLFVDPTGKGDFFPSVYALSAYPSICKCIELNETVDVKIKKGANLFWVGVANRDELSDEIEGDEVVGFINASDKTVVGVGAMAMSVRDMKEKETVSGTAAYNLHHVDDQLYEIGDKKLGIVVFDAFGEKKAPEEDEAEEKGKKKKKKDKDDKKKKKAKKEEIEEEEEVDMSAFLGFKKAQQDSTEAHWDKKQTRANLRLLGAEDKKGKGKKPKGGKKGGGGGDNWDEGEEEMVEEKNTVNNIPMSKKDKKNKKKGKRGKGKQDEGESEEENEPADVNQDGEEGEEGAEKVKPPSTKEMDASLKEAFMNSLKLSLNDKDIPLEAGKIWSNHMLLCKTEGQNLDFKHSSYKKLGKFLSAMEKEGLIIYKEANKKHPTAQIQKVHWTNEKLESYEPTIDAPMVKDEWNETKKKADTEGNWQTDILVEEVCVPKKGYEFFFDDFESKADWNFDEAIKKLDNYLKKNKLINKDNVIVNNMLAETFGLQKEEAPQPEPEEGMVEEEDQGNKKKKKVKTRTGETLNMIKRTELDQKFCNCLEWCYNINNKETQKKQTKKGRFKGITITAEKSHNKQITKVAGLTFFQPNFDKLQNHWQTKFASSVTVNELPDKKNPGKEIVVQGAWIHPIKDFIVDEMKIGDNMITLVNKLARKTQEGGGAR